MSFVTISQIHGNHCVKRAFFKPLSLYLCHYIHFMSFSVDRSIDTFLILKYLSLY
jgi:hypothetical protein